MIEGGCVRCDFEEVCELRTFRQKIKICQFNCVCLHIHKGRICVAQFNVRR